MSSKHLIIAGLPRSGSTSLYTYLLGHPEICASNIKETQYFLKALDGENLGNQEEYQKHFAHCTGQKYFMEASPSYYFKGKAIAKKIHETLNDPRIILLLRDPVDRVISYFTHEKMVGNVPKNIDFEDLLGSDKFLREKVIETGFYINYLIEWFDYFDGSIDVLFFEDLKECPFDLMKNLCEKLSISHQIFVDYNFTVENRGALHRNKYLHFIARTLNNKFETFLRRHLWLKHWLRFIYFYVNGMNNEQLDIQPETRIYLENLYRPYNEKLYHFLNSKGCEVRGWLLKHENDG